MEPHAAKGKVGPQEGERADFPALGNRFVASPGETVAKPRGVPHAFWNPGDEEARLLELISPGAFERYFVEMAPLLNVDGERDFERIGEIQARYSLSMDIDSIGPLMHEHGLQA